MLTPRQLATLIALCRRMVPLPDEPDPSAVRLARAVEVRLGTLDPEKGRDIAGLLWMMGTPAAGLLSAWRPRGFADLSAGRQDAWLRGWETSRIPLARTAFQALRRLILSAHYADPSTHPGIGYRGPLHTRTPEVAWEGPLPGASSDAEPVARTEGARTARVISIRPQLDLLSGDPTLSSIIEGARLRGDTRVRADVCVIGSGAGGAVAAVRLAEAGHEVVLLEEGAFWRHGQFTERLRNSRARVSAAGRGGPRGSAAGASPPARAAGSGHRMRRSPGQAPTPTPTPPQSISKRPAFQCLRKTTRRGRFASPAPCSPFVQAATAYAIGWRWAAL